MAINSITLALAKKEIKTALSSTLVNIDRIQLSDDKTKVVAIGTDGEVYELGDASELTEEQYEIISSLSIVDGNLYFKGNPIGDNLSEEQVDLINSIIDKADITYVDSELNAINTELDKKADTTYTDSELLKKADKSDTYTKQEVKDEIEKVIDAAPDALNTLKEIADALNNDPDFANTVINQLSKKVDKVDGQGLSDENYTLQEKEKLAGVEPEANKYIHPETHPASMITGLPTKLPADGGHADSADKLKTTRKINGVEFDGTKDITIADNTKEPSFTKNTAFNKNFGTSEGTVAQGNDPRLSDARPPTEHDHDDRYYTKNETDKNFATNENVDSLESNIGVLGDLITENKNNLVEAINENNDGINNLSDDLKQANIELSNTKTKVDVLLGEYFKYDDELGEYVGFDIFWNSKKNGKIYTVEFSKLTPNSSGEKKDDNAGMVCEPSTNTIKGRNDYENIGLFTSIDVNAYVDENDDYHINAIKGDDKFKKDGTNGDVYVMAMPLFLKRFEDSEKWGYSISDTHYNGFNPIQENIKVDGNTRPYLLHAKYIAGRNQYDDNKIASISGVAPEHTGMSHDGQIDIFKQKGIQYSGKTSHDDFYAQLMFWIKYATTNNEDIMSGCINYYLQYDNKIVENNVKRVIIPTSQANNLLIGSCVSIGDYEGSTKTDDRAEPRNFNLANRVKVTNIETFDDVNSIVYVDSNNTFNTSLTTTITTYPWQSGSCDSVLGQDGSPFNVKSAKEPFIINGIEIMVGGYEVIQNLIIYNDNTDVDNYNIKVYTIYDCQKYNKGSVTSDYSLLEYRLPQTNQVWKYISKIEVDSSNPSVLIPTVAEGSSSTWFGDGVYTNVPITGYREWLSLGALGSGSICGLRCLLGADALARSAWYILGRLSSTGRSGVN